jgi:hypothetical protein
MRLLNSKTLGLEEYIGSEIPRYAILSHRWEHDEVTYANMREGGFNSKAGFDKIKKCCAQAVEEQLDYVWVDTCCIDKSSSAELTEAINSMYQWYKGAVVCYAYLSDVTPCVEDDYRNTGPEWILNTSITKTQLAQSLWFTRGWTLQELIAPQTVIFFANGHNGWLRIGAKKSLARLLAHCTEIDEAVLRGNRDVREYSVAAKMSWAARRITTREEDMAYSLLGLFDVNMPLLYGEGRSAFIRLQEEIMKQSDDQSLFAWNVATTSALSTISSSFGLLATSPSQFENSGSIVAIPDFESQTPYQMTNRGLRIELPLILDAGRQCFGILQCAYQGNYLEQIALPLIRLADHSNMYFSRDGLYKSGRLLSVASDMISQGTKMTIFVRPPWQQSTRTSDWQDGVLLRFNNPKTNHDLDTKVTYLTIPALPVMPLPTAANSMFQYLLLPRPHQQGNLLFVGPDNSRIGIFFDISRNLSCKVFVSRRCLCEVCGDTLLDFKSIYERLLESACLIPERNVLSNPHGSHEMSSNDCLVILYNHLSTNATSQSFEYLPNDLAVFVELRPTLIRGQPMVMLDVDFQNRCVCGCISETQVTPQLCEIDASDTEIEAQSTNDLATRPKLLRIKSLMSSMLRSKSNVNSKNPLVDLSSLE